MFRTQPPPAQRLLIFARLPVLGDVKTRLAATIGDARALAVYEAMLRDTLHSVGLSDESLSIEVLWAPGRHVDSTLLRRAFPGYALAMQTGPTLGDRLAIAFSERFYFHRTQKIVAIGVDDPLLPRTLIDSAFELLDSCEWVLGPATDGGYYLIGCRAAAFDNEVFGGIDWGTDSVFSATVSKIRAWQTTLAVLPARSDIDVADDLHRFIRQSPPGELSRLLTEWQWDQQ